MSLSTEHVYTLADLKNWSQHFPADHTALAVIGHPIAHSLSPVMHNAALAALAKSRPEFAKWRYFKFDIAPEQLETAIDLFGENKFHGLNLTVPHKTIVMGLPAFKVAPQQQFLREMGAANTLKRKDHGWYGYNTDGFGLKNALAHDLGIKLENQHVVLLGAGGAARAGAMMCVGIGASLWIGNRTKINRDTLIKELKKSMSYKAHENVSLAGFDLVNPPPALSAGAIVINATSLGLKPSDESPLDLEKIPRPAAVFDMIYRPAQTRLLKQAAEMGIPHANGLSMLVYQGASSLEHWIESPLPSDVLDLMHRTVHAALK
jgi:shikimate dehydrogenase